VATWRGSVTVESVIDVFARRMVGWRVSSALLTDVVLDALEQAIYDHCVRTPATASITATAGTQYLSMRYTRAAGQTGRV
jgi:transposase InsO family protein